MYIFGIVVVIFTVVSFFPHLPFSLVSNRVLCRLFRDLIADDLAFLLSCDNPLWTWRSVVTTLDRDTKSLVLFGLRQKVANPQPHTVLTFGIRVWQ